MKFSKLYITITMLNMLKEIKDKNEKFGRKMEIIKQSNELRSKWFY